jgi:hypothetical protein
MLVYQWCISRHLRISGVQVDVGVPMLYQWTLVYQWCISRYWYMNGVSVDAGVSVAYQSTFMNHSTFVPVVYQSTYVPQWLYQSFSISTSITLLQDLNSANRFFEITDKFNF